MSLFESIPTGAREGPARPLAERMRPRTLAEYVGQEHLIGVGKDLRTAIERGHAGSLLLFGPPGVGKTTLAGSSPRPPTSTSCRSPRCSRG